MNFKASIDNTDRKSVALKDTDLIYRACSSAFARDLGFTSPSQIIGKTDIELQESAVAMYLLRLESSLVLLGKTNVSPHITSLKKPQKPDKIVIRKPLISDNKNVIGLDIHIIDQKPDCNVSDESTVSIPTLEAAQKNINPAQLSHSNIQNVEPLKSHSPNNSKSFDCFATKDLNLIYRSCSQSYALELGFSSPQQLIGKTDIELYSSAKSKELLLLESSLILFAKVNVSPFKADSQMPLVSHKVIVRKPLFSSEGRVSGLDIRIITREPGKVEVESGKSSVSVESLSIVDPHQHGITLDQLTIRKSDISVVRKANSADFRHLMDAMPHGVMVFRADTILYVNRTAANILGYVAPAQLLRLGTVTSVLQLDDWVKKNTSIQLPVARYQSQLAEKIELLGIAKNGHRLVLQAQAQIVRWLDESAIQLSFVDNTEQALSEQMLAESEQRFKSYAEASADFFWEMDKSLRFTYMSEQAESAFGLSVNELIGLSSQDFAKNTKLEEELESWTEQLDRLLHYQRFHDFEFKWKHPNGSMHVIRYNGIPLYDNEGHFKGYRGTGRDVTGLHQRVEAVTYLASHDSLTGLVNRRKFEESVKLVIKRARNDNETHALCFLDLDNFKVVNDTCGHHAGDELLKQLSSLFRTQVRKSDVLARIGGDEFAMLLYNCGVSEALRLANQLRSEVENFKFLWEENRFSVGVSMGVVLVDQRWENIESLFRAADSACYVAKDRGRNRVEIYRDSETPKNVRQGETHWVDQINLAIVDKRLKLSQQKILPLKKNGKQYFEILMRLLTSDGALINPQSFLPAAERYGLATKLDETVLSSTLNWLKASPQLLDHLGMCSINLTGQSFANEMFIDSMIKQIAESGLPANKLCFELTETATISNLSSATQFMHRLNQIGCQFALDNFGSGISSFTYLKNLPVDYLKIDGVFVRGILQDPVERAMVKAINEIGQTIGRKTIATYVENAQLLSTVTDIGVDFAQGFHIGHPEIVD